jgi:CRISPR-associated protein (TIGR02710 family)
MDEFADKLARLRRILEGDETYGKDGLSRGDQALAFQLEEMLDDIVERARQNSGDALPKERVDLLISLSGFSPLTTIVVARLLRPRRLLVINSEASKSSVDVIAEQLIGPGGLRHRDFMHESVTPTDPRSIYQVVKAKLDGGSGRRLALPYAVIDITGGRKVMSATAALAAWQLNLRLCYLEGAYSQELRQNLPGKDRLMLLDNPAALFGDQAMDRTKAMFDSGAFDAARAQYEQLAQSVPDPIRARFMQALSGLYQAWCDLNLLAIPDRASQVRTELGRLDREISAADRRHLDAQLEFVARLASAESPAELILCFYLLGQHYERIGRQDFAALLFYRTIEGALTQRLEAVLDGFYCASPDYHVFPRGEAYALDAYRRSQREAGLAESRALPSVVGSFAAALLLTQLDDPMLDAAGMRKPKKLGELRTVNEIRNRSVLAHGSTSISAADTARLLNTAKTVLEAFWTLHGTGGSVSARCDELAFIRAPF